MISDSGGRLFLFGNEEEEGKEEEGSEGGGGEGRVLAFVLSFFPILKARRKQAIVMRPTEQLAEREGEAETTEDFPMHPSKRMEREV